MWNRNRRNSWHLRIHPWSQMSLFHNHTTAISLYQPAPMGVSCWGPARWQARPASLPDVVTLPGDGASTTGTQHYYYTLHYMVGRVYNNHTNSPLTDTSSYSPHTQNVTHTGLIIPHYSILSYSHPPQPIIPPPPRPLYTLIGSMSLP